MARITPLVLLSSAALGSVAVAQTRLEPDAGPDAPPEVAKAPEEPSTPPATPPLTSPGETPKDETKQKKAKPERTKLRLSGFMQVFYRYGFHTGADPVVDPSNFRVQRVRVALDGDLLPWLAYDISIDPRAPEITGVLRDAYFTLHAIPHHRIRIGQQKTQFGYENTESSSRLFAVNRTEVSDNLSRGTTLRAALALTCKTTTTVARTCSVASVFATRPTLTGSGSASRGGRRPVRYRGRSDRSRRRLLIEVQARRNRYRGRHAVAIRQR